MLLFCDDLLEEFVDVVWAGVLGGGRLVGVVFLAAGAHVIGVGWEVGRVVWSSGGLLLGGK